MTDNLFSLEYGIWSSADKQYRSQSFRWWTGCYKQHCPQPQTKNFSDLTGVYEEFFILASQALKEN